MDLVALFRQKGALLDGHFQLTSGLHSSGYLQCARVLQYPDVAADLGKLLADKIAAAVGRPDVIISPAMGGIIIGHEVARALGLPFLFAERESGKFKLRRGFGLEPGSRCVVVEDVITTGGSSQEVIDMASALGAIPRAVGSIFDRSSGKAVAKHDGVSLPLCCLGQLALPVYTPELCPLCREGSTAVKPGSRPAP